jgi:cysteine-rich repeat protein
MKLGAWLRRFSTVGVAMVAIVAARPAIAIDLTGRWRFGNGFFDIAQAGSAASFTLFGRAYTGTVSATGHLTASTSDPACTPLNFIDAQFVAEHLDGSFGCGGPFPVPDVGRVFAQRCECFDGNASDGDGCDARCRIEPCFSCAGDPSVCTPLAAGAACNDGRDCTSGETCNGSACGGGSIDPSCTDLTGRWLLRYRDELYVLLEEQVDVIQTDHTLEFRDPTSGSPGFFGTINASTGVFDMSEPSSFLSCLLADNGAVDPLVGAPSPDGTTWIGTGTYRISNLMDCFDDPFSVTATRCGGGTIDPGEQCDDGNVQDGDGCSSTCQLEVAAPLAENLKCYKIRDLRSPAFAPARVDLADEFAVNDGAFEVKKPFLFCTPVSQDGAPIINSDHYLTCYKTKGPRLASSARPRVEISNDLGPLQLEVKRAQLICLRSASSPLP